MSTDPKEQRRTRHPLPAVDRLTPDEIASLREEMLRDEQKMAEYLANSTRAKARRAALKR